MKPRKPRNPGAPRPGWGDYMRVPYMVRLEDPWTVSGTMTLLPGTYVHAIRVSDADCDQDGFFPTQWEGFVRLAGEWHHVEGSAEDFLASDVVMEDY